MSRALSHEERELLYHVEVLGMPVQRAADILGIRQPLKLLGDPEVDAARSQLRDGLRHQAKVTKEMVTQGVLDAIQQAELIGEPATRIAGWREINKMYGFDSPKKLEITLTDSRLDTEIRSMTQAELLELLEDDAIDAEFYRDDA